LGEIAIMPSCINVLRAAAQNYSLPLNPNKCAWISIGEPDDAKSLFANEHLDKLPNLKIAFWDLVEPAPLLGCYGAMVYPPTIEDAGKIVDFIFAHKGKNFLVNCAAGVSRSAAVCMFLENVLYYKWVEEGKKNSKPNTKLYHLMVEYYCSMPDAQVFNP